VENTNPLSNGIPLLPHRLQDRRISFCGPS